MCIVSFVLDKDKFILTFNRDENPFRESEKPNWRSFGQQMVFCPVDHNAGGTWIGYNRLIIACLQNGAFVKHTRTSPYKKSRGQILKEVLISNDYKVLINNYDFTGIEPFTMCVFDSQIKILSIYVFDGQTLDKRISDLQNPELLLSCTLYDEEAHQSVLNDFIKCNKESDSLFSFHKDRRIGSIKNQFTRVVSTVSVTQFELENNQFKCMYYDALKNQTFKIIE